MAYNITLGRFFGPPGGTVETYAAGTLSPLPTYTTAAAVVANPTTISIPASGYVPIWGGDGVSYRFIIKDSAGVVVYDQDNISGTSGGTTGGGSTSFQTEVQTLPAGSTAVTLTGMTYTPGTRSLFVFADGLVLTSGTDFAETSTSGFTLTEAFPADVQLLIVSGRFVSTGVDGSAVSLPSPGTGGQTVSLLSEIARFGLSVHRFAGVVGDGVNDDTAGLQAAINLAQSLNALLVFDRTKTYLTTAPLVWQHGRNLSDTVTYEVHVEGNRCTMLPNHNGDLFRIEPRCPDSAVGTGREIAPIDFGGFFVNGFYVDTNNWSSARALRIGKTGFMVDSFEKSRIHDITVQRFEAAPFYIEQARMLKCERLITRDMSGGVYLQILRDGFVGDITFEDCEFQGDETRRTFHVYAASSTAFAEARGIRFLNCVFYGSGGRLQSGQNGKLDDIWISDCACDGPDAPAGENPIEVYAHDGGSISQVFIKHPYIVNYTGTAIIIRSTDTAQLRAIEVNGGYIRQITAAAVIDIEAAENTTVRGVHFVDNVGTDEVLIRGASNHVSVRDCDSDSGATNFCSVTGSTDNFVVRGNIYTNSGGIVRTASGVTYSVTDNLLVTA